MMKFNQNLLTAGISAIVTDWCRGIDDFQICDSICGLLTDNLINYCQGQ